MAPELTGLTKKPGKNKIACHNIILYRPLEQSLTGFRTLSGIAGQPRWIANLKGLLYIPCLTLCCPSGYF